MNLYIANNILSEYSYDLLFNKTKKNHKVLKNGPKIKTIPSNERGDHVESKYTIKNEFYVFKILKKGR